MPTAAIPSSSAAELVLPIAALFADYWFDVDHRWGRHASEMYLNAGVFEIGDERMQGREAVRAFYGWREGRGARVARHVISNLRVMPRAQDHADVDAILCLYAADGAPVLESKPPILLADVTAECVRDVDGRWRFASHLLQPVFAGGAPITVPPRGVT